MSEPTDHQPSPIPVPWPFHPPYDLEPDHPLYSHVSHERKQQADVQRRRDAEWDEFDRDYQKGRLTRTRREQTRHQTVTSCDNPQLRERQHDRGHYDPIADSRGPLTDARGPSGGRERWIYLGNSYTRDSPDSEWVESPKPTIHPVTDIYGFPPADPMYRPDLRYTPREFDEGNSQRGQVAMPPMDKEPQRAMGRPEMAPSLAGGVHGGSSHSGPRPPSPPPIPYRPTDVYSLPRRSAQQDRNHDPGYGTQPSSGRTSADHGLPTRPDAAQPRHSAASSAPADRLETREDPWEFLFGSKGYVTIAPGDESPFWWDWKD